MGNQQAKDNSTTKADTSPDGQFKSTHPDVILNRVYISIANGKKALSQQEFDDAFNYFRVSAAILDMYINEDFISDDTKAKLIDIKMKLDWSLYKLQCRELLTIHLKEFQQNDNEKQISMKDLKLPDEIFEEMNDGRNPESLSEEAKAFLRIIQNVEVCKPKVQMKDIVGQQKAIEVLRNKVIRKYKRPNLSKNAHVQGVMFFGPPGNGKTTVATAVANEVGRGKRPYFKVSVDKLLSKYHGQTEMAIGALFKLAALNGPSIIFIDEVDSLFKSRSNSDGSDSTGNGLVQLFLDKVSSNKNVFILCATNYPWLVDEAFYRRFKPIYLEMPTRNDRLNMAKSIFKHTDHVLIKKEFEFFADNTKGLSFDEIAILKEEMTDMAQTIGYNATHFRVTKTTEEGFKKTWTPCLESEKGAIKMSADDIPDEDQILCPPVTGDIMKRVVLSYTPTVSEETIQKHDVFDKKGIAGIQELNKQKKEALSAPIYTAPKYESSKKNNWDAYS